MLLRFSKLSLLLLVIFSLIRCNNNDDDGPAEAPQVKFRAQVAGAPFRTDDATGILSNDGRLLVITGTNDINQTITLLVGSSSDNATPLTEEETYLINDDNTASITYTSGSMTFVPVIEAGGSITISGLDRDQNTIFGSFTGVVTNPDGGELAIEAGNLFNISIIEQ